MELVPCPLKFVCNWTKCLIFRVLSSLWSASRQNVCAANFRNWLKYLLKTIHIVFFIKYRFSKTEQVANFIPLKAVLHKLGTLKIDDCCIWRDRHWFISLIKCLLNCKNIASQLHFLNYCYIDLVTLSREALKIVFHFKHNVLVHFLCKAHMSTCYKYTQNKSSQPKFVFSPWSSPPPPPPPQQQKKEKNNGNIVTFELWVFYIINTSWAK